jgi:Protein of unknown function (DUF2500).
MNNPELLVAILFPSIFVLIIGILLLGCFVPGKIRRRKRKREFEAASEHTTKVKVISKTSRISRTGPTGGLRYYFDTYYYVSFQFENGRRENFKLSLKRYNLIAENETGLLTYRENEKHVFFVNFAPTN